MFCPNCGSPLKEGIKFCTNCGSKVPDMPADITPPVVEPEQPAVAEPPAKKPVPPKKKSKIGLVLGILGGLVLIGVALVIVLVILPGQKRAKTYEEAVARMAEKDYAGAEAIFAECFAKEAGSDIP